MQALVRNRSLANPWRWAVWGSLAGLLLAAVLFAPARWLAGWVYSASVGQVSLPDAQGSIWSGSSLMLLSGGAGSQGSVALPGRVVWQLRPSLSGVNLQLFAPCCMAQALRLSTRLGLSRVVIAVTDHASNWPAGLLAGLGTPWNTIAAEGNLAVSSRGLSVEWAEGRVSLMGGLQIDAQDMASRLTTFNPVGSYRLLLDGGPLVSLKVLTLKGSLQLNGAGQWVGGRLRFEGVASAAPERLDALSNLLNIIGRREGAQSIIKVG
jgi:general secretion pathway protein N